MVRTRYDIIGLFVYRTRPDDVQIGTAEPQRLLNKLVRANLTLELRLLKTRFQSQKPPKPPMVVVVVIPI